MAGYSVIPLEKKLGLKEGMRVVVINPPEEHLSWLQTHRYVFRIGKRVIQESVFVHVFTRDRSELERLLHKARKAIHPAGVVWVSWPKKAAKIDTTVTEDVIRELALPLGFVDVKVCSVNDVWSGLKLVIRKNERKYVLNCR